MKRNLISAAVRSALGLAAIAVLNPALAQQDESQAYDADQVEEVVVTGSRIKRIDPELAVPVQVFNSDYIKNSGASSIQEFLFTANFAGPSIFSENETLSQSAGSAQFDSRGFGVDYVLLLLNGRRLPADPQAGSNATNLNLIPMAAVERIEFLSTGASAIYGADAVQGVINVITRSNFDGMQTEFRTEAMENGDGVKHNFSFSGGVTGDKGWMMASVDYQTQESVSANGLPLIGSAISPTGIDGRSPTGLPASYMDLANDITYAAADCPEGSARPAEYTSQGENCAYDVGPIYEAVPAQERFNFLASGELELAENITGYGEFRFSRNVTEVRNGAAPAYFNITGAESLAGIDEQLGSDLANSEAVYIFRRFVDAGPRSTDNTNTAFSSVFGARFDLGSGHELDVSFQTVESEMNRVGVGGQLSTSRVEAAVADGTFDPTQTYSPAFFEENELAVSTQRQSTGTENTLTANLTGELPFSVGQSKVGYSFGARFKEDEFSDRSDALSTSGDIAGGASSNGGGSRENTAVYGEIAMNPLEDLEISLAARYDDYSWEGLGVSSGDDATTWNLAASYRIMDNLMVRASTGTGFKAPTLGDLFLGQSFGVTTAVDTAKCNTAKADPGSSDDEIATACRQVEIRSVSGGNPELETEESKNYSLGLVYEPIDNMLLAVDYYNIQVEGKIGSLGVQELIDNEALYPDLVTRVNGSLSIPGAEVRSNLQNLNEENGEGIDFSGRYSFELAGGTMFTDFRAAYLMSHERQISAIQPLCDEAGTTSEPEWRFNNQIGWSKDRFSVALTGRYIGETEDTIGGRDTENFSCAPGEESRVETADSYFELGLKGTYDFSDNTSFTLGIINLTDEEPVYSETAGTGWPWYDQALYDPRGTRWYLSVSHSFE
ncbi:TonB-dependent receptor plug domain-containing protein [Microbulbifer sp. JMSA003]|uniref:TonB-dependent receptor plug domain-containing protein n=1 Tax=Microbulbifer sp. JMSA003 TaxID=3243369 RepID=UPI00403A6BAC